MRVGNEKRLWLALLAALVVASAALVVPVRALAQGDTEAPVAYAVLLWSPQCPHCHAFIENDYPLMKEEFGEQFQLLFVNVLSEGGRALAVELYEAYGIPEDQRYVPMMLMGEHVLVGGVEIPQRGGELIREALAADGIALPNVPGLQSAYQAALGQMEGQPESETTAEAPVAADAAGASAGAVGARIARDPVGNGLAIAVLLGLGASLVAVVAAGLPALSTPAKRTARWLSGPARRTIAVVVALAGLGVALSLVAKAGGGGLALGLAALVGLLLLAVAGALVLPGRKELPGWLIPAVALAGLAAAVYLAYVEVGQQEAFCGAVGDCNTVQQSPYATLFGVLPVGVLGVTGYVLILVAWAVARWGEGRTRDLAQVALLGMALGGVAFSTYLTFLEPFVIGATCAWCLTSALVMLLLLWLTAPAGLDALRRLRSPAPAKSSGRQPA